MIFTFNEDWKLNKFIFYILVSIKMGNRLASSIQSVQLLAALVYKVLREKWSVYMYGRLNNVQSPLGLTLQEIQDFESQFGSFVMCRRYGHRLDAEVHPCLKLTIAGSEPQEVDPDTIVAPRCKPDKTPVIVPLDQLNFNCNTVHAIALLVQYFTGSLPSRLYMYYYSRESLEQPPNHGNTVDEGVSFSDVFALLNMAEPIPAEDKWPYSVQLVNTKPRYDPEDVPYFPFVGVQLNPALSNLKTCLELNGPFVSAVSATKDFELHGRYNYNPADVLEGYQPLLFTGFSEETQTFTAINSFGAGWGDRGTVQLHISDLYKDPIFTNAIYTLVPDLQSSDEEKSD